MFKVICKYNQGFFAAIAMICLLAAAPMAYAVGTPSGTVITNTAGMSFTDLSGNVFTATSNTISITVATVTGVSFACSGDQAIPGGSVAYYACTVTNTGNNPDTFALTASSTLGWVTPILIDNGAGGGTANDGIHQVGETTVTATTGVLAGDAISYFFVTVQVPSNSLNGVTSVFTLGITDGGTATGTVSKTTTVNAPTATLAKYWRNVTQAGIFSQGPGSGIPGDVIEYQVKITNGGAAAMTNGLFTDILNVNMTFVPNSLYAGSNGVSNAAAGNTLRTDNTTGDTCAVELCATGNYNGGNKTISFLTGNGATETVGGTFGAGAVMYVYYRSTIN